MNINILVDHFVDNNDEETTLVLLKTLAYPEQGGLGYKLKLFNPSIDLDGWRFNHQTKSIYLDTAGVFGKYNVASISKALKESLDG